MPEEELRAAERIERCSFFVVDRPRSSDSARFTNFVRGGPLAMPFREAYKGPVTNEELLADLRRVEAARAQKQAEFLRAVDDRVPHEDLCRLHSELEALTELAAAAVRRAIEGVNSNSRESEARILDASHTPDCDGRK
jgi:hypothetical protein